MAPSIILPNSSHSLNLTDMVSIINLIMGLRVLRDTVTACVRSCKHEGSG